MLLKVTDFSFVSCFVSCFWQYWIKNHVSPLYLLLAAKIKTSAWGSWQRLKNTLNSEHILQFSGFDYGMEVKFLQ